MNIFDREYQTKREIEWEAHCQRVRAERETSARLRFATTRLDKLYDVLYDEQRDLGYDDLRDSFNAGGVTGWDAGNDPNELTEPRQE